MPQGTATLDFGAFPGKSDTSATVTGQTTIASGSLVESWIRPVATSDHTADEHLVETIKVVAGNIVAGTGFTIYGFNTNQINEPLIPSGGSQHPSILGIAQYPNSGGTGTRIYGLWTVAWAWN